MKTLKKAILSVIILIFAQSIYGTTKDSVKIKLQNNSKEVVLRKLKTPFFKPPHIQGDRDFGGNGPHTTCKVSIKLSADRKRIIAVVYMKARETKSDWTTGEGTKEFTIFKTRNNQSIRSIKNRVKYSSCNYTDYDHEKDYVIKGLGETSTDAQKSNWQLINTGHNDALVEMYLFSGDTNGDDISKKTGVQIYFKDIIVDLIGLPLNEKQLSLKTGTYTCGNNTCGSSATATFLNYHGINRTCNQMKKLLESSPNLINHIRKVSGKNIGIDPNSVRDRLNELKNQFILEEINNSSVINRIIELIEESKPVIALTGWGSKTVRDIHIKPSDNVSLNPNSVLHYIVVDGFNYQTSVFSIIDNGSRKYVHADYLREIILWHPENFIIEGALYSNQVKPGEIIYSKIAPYKPALVYNNPPVYPIVSKVSKLLFEIKTGGDDLRGGNDNVNLHIEFKDGRKQVLRNANKKQKWPDHKTQYVEVNLNYKTDISNIDCVKLETTFSGGIGGDNWNVNKVKITAIKTDGSRKLLYQKGTGSSLLFRFTKDHKWLTIK